MIGPIFLLHGIIGWYIIFLYTKIERRDFSGQTGVNFIYQTGSGQTGTSSGTQSGGTGYFRVA